MACTSFGTCVMCFQKFGPYTYVTAICKECEEKMHDQKVTHEVEALVIEKKICEALGIQWMPTGMSVITLVDKLIFEYKKIRHDRLL